MTDKPATTYVVSVFEKPHWRAVLTTKDKQNALDMAKEIGDKGSTRSLRSRRSARARRDVKVETGVFTVTGSEIAASVGVVEEPDTLEATAVIGVGLALRSLIIPEGKHPTGYFCDPHQ